MPACRAAVAPCRHGRSRPTATPCPNDGSISFQATETAASIRHAAEAAVRHYPLPASFEGIPRAEPWCGLAFGIFRDRCRGYNDPDLSFFGLTLPTVETVYGGTWFIRVDIKDCPNLELVLPARKEAIENAFLKEMRDAACRAICRAMAAAPEPRPALEDWKRAREAGIDIVPPPAQLRPWTKDPPRPAQRLFRRPVRRRPRRICLTGRGRSLSPALA